MSVFGKTNAHMMPRGPDADLAVIKADPSKSYMSRAVTTGSALLPLGDDASTPLPADDDDDDDDNDDDNDNDVPSSSSGTP